MKIIINKANPQIRITAPEITQTEIDGVKIYWIPGVHEVCGSLLLLENWTLVEEEETIVKTIKEFVEKGKRCEQQAVEDNDQENYIFWCGFRNCAENILREVEGPTEGIKGNLEEIPSNVDLEKEIDFYIGVYFLKCEDGTLLNADGDELRFTDVRKIAKHFYELGKGGSK